MSEPICRNCRQPQSHANHDLAHGCLFSPLPSNWVAEINGHHIFRDDRHGDYCIFTPGEGWWAYGLTEEYARRTCEVVAPAKRSAGRTQETE